MKKYSGIILCFFLLFLAGCGQDQYAIERQYYQAKKQAINVFKNPRSTPPNELKKIVNTFQNFALKYPKSNLAVDAQFSIASLYIATEEYEDARAQLNKMINMYPKFDEILATAVFLKGNSYEAQNNWNSALSQYKKLMQDHPLTQRGLSMPIYIAQHYKAKFQPDKMMEAYREAITHYDSLAGKHPGTPLALQLNTLSAQCYGELKDWQGAINTFNAILENYKGKVNMDGVLINMAMIYSRELKDNSKAKEALQKLINDYPKSKLVEPAKKLIKKLE